MRVLRLDIKRFRGFEDVSFAPRGHVVLVGEPGAGRSDVVSALTRVLHPNSTRSVVDVYDLFQQGASGSAEVTAVLGSLGPDLEQRFLSQLEVWSEAEEEFVDDVDITSIGAGQSLVLRLGYRATWEADEESGEHMVFYPKLSDPTIGRWAKVPRVDRLALPFVLAASTRPLQIRVEGDFRALVEMLDSPPGGLAHALTELASGVEALTGELSTQPAVLAALEALLEPLRARLFLTGPASDVVRFAPDGGSLPGLLRSLMAAVDLDDGAGFLPVRRHGSTLAAQFSASEALALAGAEGSVVAWDDFGDGLDETATEHLADRLRRTAGQAWISTRHPDATRAFRLQEVVRLTRHGGRAAHSASVGSSRAERLAARYAKNLLVPCMTSRAIVVCEGPHDVEALDALAQRRALSKGADVPASMGLRFVHAGSVDEIARVATVARTLGFHVVAAIDHDQSGSISDARFGEISAAASASVRLPPGFAIERAIVDGISLAHLRTAMDGLKAAFSLPWPNASALGDDDVAKHLIANIKGRSLHEPLILLLPTEPPVLARYLDAVLDLSQPGSSGSQTLTA